MIIPIDEALKLTSTDDIQKQIDIRRSLIDQCTGTLYPSIMYCEIDKLIKRKKEVTANGMQEK